MRELWQEELDRIVLFLNTAEEKQARSLWDVAHCLAWS